MGTPTKYRLQLMVQWVIAIACFYMGIIWFSNQPLQNNSEVSRRQVWLEIPELLADHLVPSHDGTGIVSPSGWQYFPERLGPLAIAITILGFAWGWGSLVVRRLLSDYGTFDRLERCYWSLCIGLAVWGTLTLLLGLCGWLSRPVFVGAGVAPMAIALKQFWGARRSAIARPQTRPIMHGLGWWCLLLVAPFLLAILLGSLQPPNDFDVKEYHLGGVKEFFLRGRIEMLPHNVYTSFPFLTEMLCLSGMVLRSDWWEGALAGQSVLSSFAPLTALGVFIAARRWCGLYAGWFAVLAHLTCPWVYRISIIAYAEGGLACFLFASFMATMRAIECRDHQMSVRWTLFAGCLAGAAAGCKYPAVLTVVIPLGVMLIIGCRWRSCRVTVESEAVPHAASNPLPRWRILAQRAVLYSCGVLATFGPWLGKNACETGNPVYPLVYSVFGGTDWDAAADAKWKAGHPLPLKDITGVSWVLRDTRDRLWDVFVGSDWQSAVYLSLAVACVFAIWNRPQRTAGRSIDAVVLRCAALYSLWLFLSWQYFTHRIDRFWVPMLPMLSLLAGVAFAWMWEAVESITLDRSREVYWSIKGVLLLPVVSMVCFNLAVATSPLGGNNSYLMRMQDLRKLTQTPCVAYTETLALSSTDKVLFVGEAELFDANFAYEYNTVFDHSLFEQDCRASTKGREKDKPGIRSADEILNVWRSRGVTHVVVNWSEVLRYRTTYGFSDFVHPHRFQELVQAGVLAPAREPHLGSFELMSKEKQAEVIRWAPELILPGNSETRPVILFEAYQVQ